MDQILLLPNFFFSVVVVLEISTSPGLLRSTESFRKITTLFRPLALGGQKYRQRDLIVRALARIKKNQYRPLALAKRLKRSQVSHNCFINVSIEIRQTYTDVLDFVRITERESGVRQT